MVLEDVIAPMVAGPAVGTVVLRTVRLDDQATAQIEQVGYAQQSPAEVEHGPVLDEVTPRHGRFDDDPGPRLQRARGTLTRLLYSGAGLSDPSGLPMPCDQRPDGIDSGTRSSADPAHRHVGDDHCLGDVGCPTHFVISRPRDRGQRDAVDRASFVGEQLRARGLDAWPVDQAMPRTGVQQYVVWPPQAIQAIYHGDALVVHRRPPAQASARWQQRCRVEDPSQWMGSVVAVGSGDPVVRMVPLQSAYLVRRDAEPAKSTGGRCMTGNLIHTRIGSRREAACSVIHRPGTIGGSRIAKPAGVSRNLPTASGTG